MFEMPTFASKETKPLYKERPFLEVDKKIEELEKVERGEIRTLELDEKEKSELFEFENKLGEELEGIYNIKINSVSFYQEYFLTEEGRKKFKEVTGEDILGINPQAVKFQLLKNRSMLDAVDSKKLSDLSGESIKYTDEKLKNELLQTRDQFGRINISNIILPGSENVSRAKNPERFSITLNPQNGVSKIQKLREFKRKIKAIGNKLEQNADIASDLDSAKQNILTLYRRRVNEMIADQFYLGVRSKQLLDELGEEALTDEERMLAGSFLGLEKFQRTYARFSMFIHGSDQGYAENGNRRQVGEAMGQYADEMELKYIEAECNKEQILKEKDLDSKKIFEEKRYSQEQFSAFAEQLLELYGQKSEQPSDDYDKKRPGPAPDGKWQFVPRKEFRSMAVNGKQRIIKSQIENKSIYQLIITVLTHEPTHFLQYLNRQQLPLRLFQNISGDRTALFAEMGAMGAENKFNKEIFGFESFPHVHYIRAMEKRMDGGTYLDCVKAFYDSALKVVSEKKKRGLIDEEKFKQETESLLALAIDRSKRLFNIGDSFDSKTSILTKSKDTVYLEQYIVAQKLAEKGQDKYFFLGGMNLDTIAILAQTGLLDLSKIQTLKPFAQQIWEQEKENYKLAA